MIKVGFKNETVIDFEDAIRYEDKGSAGLILFDERRNEVGRVKDGAWDWVAG